MLTWVQTVVGGHENSHRELDKELGVEEGTLLDGEMERGIFPKLT